VSVLLLFLQQPVLPLPGYWLPGTAAFAEIGCAEDTGNELSPDPHLGLPFLYIYQLRNALLVETNQSKFLIYGTLAEA